jgi:hypothetical protein
MCRKLWETQPKDLALVNRGLDRDAVQIYVGWLYSGQLNIDEEMDRAGQEHNFLLLKAWRVSDAFQDANFRHAIIAEIISSMESDGNPGFDVDCVHYAYEEFQESSMREFMVGVFLTNFGPDNLEEVISEYPEEFTQDLCMVAVELLQKKGMTTEGLLEKFTDGALKLEHDGDGEDVKVESGEEDEEED